MTRKEFIQSVGAAAAVSVLGKSFGATGPDYDKFQAEIDEVTPKMFFDYLKGGPTDKAALRRLDAAFDKVLKEVRETVVTDKPAIWLIYNMGVIVKTKQSCFSIDLKHRRAPEIAPLLDFALITHNHGDHYSNEFYRPLSRSGAIGFSDAPSAG